MERVLAMTFKSVCTLFFYFFVGYGKKKQIHVILAIRAADTQIHVLYWVDTITLYTIKVKVNLLVGP